MKLYLVTCDWHNEFTIGVFASMRKAKKARNRHVNWMRKSIPDIRKRNYTISKITLDKVCDVWYNDYINNKE